MLHTSPDVCSNLKLFSEIAIAILFYISRFLGLLIDFVSCLYGSLHDAELFFRIPPVLGKRVVMRSWLVVPWCPSLVRIGPHEFSLPC